MASAERRKIEHLVEHLRERLFLDAERNARLADRGVGRGLLDRVERWLQSLGWNELWLLTDPDLSLRAYGFYRAAGWLDAGLDGGNRIMRKTILGRPLAPDVHPWLHIPAADYEGHMGPAGVDQLAPLSRSFADVYRRLLPPRVAVLGCATGNGFEHVDLAVTRRLVGVDIHPEYLALARRRHARLAPVLELLCRPAETCDLGAGSLDLVFAGLFFEYVDPAPMLDRIAQPHLPARDILLACELVVRES